MDLPKSLGGGGARAVFLRGGADFVRRRRPEAACDETYAQTN